jgi:hypothetical protein
MLNLINNFNQNQEVSSKKQIFDFALFYINVSMRGILNDANTLVNMQA